MEHFHGNKGPLDVAHVATAEPLEGDPGMFRVVCPHGCALGTSADRVTPEGATQRIGLHRLVTEPLGIRSDKQPGRLGFYPFPGKSVYDIEYDTEPRRFERKDVISPDFTQIGTITGRIPGAASLEVRAALDGYRKVDDSVRDALGD